MNSGSVISLTKTLSMLLLTVFRVRLALEACSGMGGTASFSFGALDSVGVLALFRI